VVDSPIGPLTLVAAGQALAGLYFADQRHAPKPDTLGPRRDRILPWVRRQLDEYFLGTRTTFTVALALVGTPFQLAVWAELSRIPCGTTATYGEVARRVGRPRAARAVGLANGRNPVALVVPCHRVVASGSLGGYGGGLDRKRWLLRHEAEMCSVGSRT